ncbi:MAG: plasmid stabilization protein [Methylothermaceae bacteria B42]|nr:MAG: plasmid stabilization protein [Methylothermaceae bacteria B42]HHJ38127.1 type II toxin-antitoxin system VapC family toxin [Methylothermaceae bacterium]
MVLLDTNVLSELMRPAPNPKVMDWLDGWPAEDVWISAITMAEILFGIRLLADGKRKSDLLRLAETMFQEDFAGSCLPFDDLAAKNYADIVAARRQAGHPITVEDAQIAAIATSCHLLLATRNTRDFEGINNLTVINPWE